MREFDLPQKIVTPVCLKESQKFWREMEDRVATE